MMNNFIQNYEFILNHLQKLEISFDDFKQIRKPKLSNLELVCLNITAEYMSIDFECQLFRLIKSTFLQNKIERSVYNRRKRKLFPYIENIRLKLAEAFNEFEDVYLIDSMPLEICKNARASRSTNCKESVVTSPTKGYCASQKNILLWL